MRPPLPAWTILCSWICMAQALPAQTSPARQHRAGVLIWQTSTEAEAALQGLRKVLDRKPGRWSYHSQRCGADAVRATRGIEAMRRQGVEIIIAIGTRAALICKRQAQDIPVVFTAVTEPVQSGVVRSWQGSTGRITGNSNWIRPTTILRGFRTAVPQLKRLGVLVSGATDLAAEAEVDGMFALFETAQDPQLRAMQLIDTEVGPKQTLAQAMQRLAAARVDAIWITGDPQIHRRATDIARLAGKLRLPLVSTAPTAGRKVAVAAVLPDYDLLGQRAAVLVRRIIAGEAPQSIPIGTMHSQHLLLNLDAARQIGLKIPLRALVVADEIIDRRAGTGGRGGR